MIWYRIAVPVWRSVRGHVVVTKIIKENSHVTSVIVSGRNLEKIATAPGQFFYWRFGTPGLMYMAHPSSVSDCSTPNQLRISVKGYGAASKALVNLRPGTRVYIEGPYGVSTSETAAPQCYASSARRITKSVSARCQNDTGHTWGRHREHNPPVWPVSLHRTCN
ncbi:hypothetical protein EBF03_05730 [Arcanobacterium haemolyticum]|nr:hypothetical protein EBF03_05730 [Arcanobacterium haemolyticum]